LAASPVHTRCRTHFLPLGCDTAFPLLPASEDANETPTILGGKMKRKNTDQHEPRRLPEGLNKRLAAYALAATAAAGAGLLGVTTPAEAKIIYTPADITVAPGPNGRTNSVQIPLTSRGNVNVAFRDFAGFGCIFPFPYTPCNQNPPGPRTNLYVVNAAIGANFRSEPPNSLPDRLFVTTPNSRIAQLASGAQIGPKTNFKGSSGEPSGGFLRDVEVIPDAVMHYGVWGVGSPGHGFVGFGFSSQRQWRFGWIGLNISGQAPSFYDRTAGYTATITGYAYETDPNKPILAGQTSDAPEPGTLTLLALGAIGLLALRRRKVVAQRS